MEHFKGRASSTHVVDMNEASKMKSIQDTHKNSRQAVALIKAEHSPAGESRRVTHPAVLAGTGTVGVGVDGEDGSASSGRRSQ